ncbi:autotransporter assembly complex protein TamA [Acinetobacter guerrae]|uniref:autotransporter assembly complex protein TamA n=1 Tax=Acinetobacter guerrae TaxID=1843371 RepID=UPI00125F8CA9|nr:autotransporter assembly complex family protein [Acinetobacter guerrae]
MLANIKFRHTTLAQSVRFILNVHDINKFICSSMLLGLYISPVAHAEDTNIEPISSSLSQSLQSKTQAVLQKNNVVNPSAQTDPVAVQNQNPVDPSTLHASQVNSQQDSQVLLQQQEQAGNKIEAFKPIEFEDLNDLPDTQIDASMANEIFKVAEEAKQEAAAARNGSSKGVESGVSNPTEQQLAQINQAPVNIDNLMQQIESDKQIVVDANTSGKTLDEVSTAEREQDDAKVGFFRRILYKIRPSSNLNTAKADPRISAEVVGAPADLAANISAKLSSYTQEAFGDFNAALPQLRSLSNQAAQAVGYYNAKFNFEKLSDSKVKVTVTPNNPVKVEEQNIEFSGEGASTPQFQVIRLVPDLDVGDILNHGKYEQTKSRIVEAASDNGYFDAYWRLHDVKVKQPEDTAAINLKYETGERYKLGNVEFRMSDPSKKIPLKMEVLQSMTPWKDGDDYAFWRVNTLANNLTNSRYFNYTLVDTIKPDPIEKPLELPPDLQALVDQQKIEEQQVASLQKADAKSGQEVTQDVADETQFAGMKLTDEQNEKLQLAKQRLEQRASENEQLQAQAREEKKVPVIVTLNADRLNSVETGIGYGTDTEFRIRTQYRRAIVNSLGHSFDANLELSKIRQSLDGRYSIPYKDPINDYINIVGGYEREDRDDIGPDVSLETESAVFGAERIIKNPMGGWQQSFGFRYRLDRLTQHGVVDNDEIPDAFKVPGSDAEQEALLFGYEISKTTSNSSVNPTRGFKQSYKVELGSESLLSDANMAILTAGWRFIYSLGENDDHQFVGRSDLSYIFTDDFDKVPYNLRFFAGGDQTIRGFDYKSLSPEEYGYKVGGQGLAVGSLEYNYQFKDGWRAAVFSDFGNAYDEKFKNDTAYSIGVGIRWKSPIGPIRLDVASGVSDDNHPIRLHFFIGSQL